MKKLTVFSVAMTACCFLTALAVTSKAQDLNNVIGAPCSNDRDCQFNEVCVPTIGSQVNRCHVVFLPEEETLPPLGQEDDPLDALMTALQGADNEDIDFIEHILELLRAAVPRSTSDVDGETLPLGRRLKQLPGEACEDDSDCIVFTHCAASADPYVKTCQR